MDYVLRGNEKDISNVIKEQRIRIRRGVINIIPISECGLITEEEVGEMMKEKCSELAVTTEENENLKSQVSDLEMNIDEKDTLIASLTVERDALKAHVLELESTIDKKELPAGDSKELLAEPSKELNTTDDKTVIVEEKKRGRPATRKTE